MIFARRDYEVTSHFIGIIWRGRALIGVDLAPWVWAIVVGPFWAGWYKEEGEEDE